MTHIHSYTHTYTRQEDYSDVHASCAYTHRVHIPTTTHAIVGGREAPQSLVSPGILMMNCWRRYNVAAFNQLPKVVQMTRILNLLAKGLIESTRSSNLYAQYLHRTWHRLWRLLWRRWELFKVDFITQTTEVSHKCAAYPSNTITSNETKIWEICAT